MSDKKFNLRKGPKSIDVQRWLFSTTNKLKLSNSIAGTLHKIARIVPSQNSGNDQTNVISKFFEQIFSLG